jgi:hypothetical protein
VQFAEHCMEEVVRFQLVALRNAGKGEQTDLRPVEIGHGTARFRAVTGEGSRRLSSS